MECVPATLGVLRIYIYGGVVQQGLDKSDGIIRRRRGSAQKYRESGMVATVDFAPSEASGACFGIPIAGSIARGLPRPGDGAGRGPEGTIAAAAGAYIGTSRGWLGTVASRGQQAPKLVDIVGPVQRPEYVTHELVRRGVGGRLPALRIAPRCGSPRTTACIKVLGEARERLRGKRAARGLVDDASAQKACDVCHSAVGQGSR